MPGWFQFTALLLSALQFGVSGSLLPAESRVYGYDARERVTSEPYLLTSSSAEIAAMVGQQSSTYQFDGNTLTGLGVRTGQGVDSVSGTYQYEYYVGAQDNFQRPTQDLAQPLDITLASSSGPSTEFLSGGGAIPVNYASTPDAAGNYTSRAVPGWQTQTLTWDAANRLALITENNGAGYQSTAGYKVTGIYDGFGRRAQTIYQPTTSGSNSGTATTLTYYYDPQVEFLELGQLDNGDRTWKIYGPDRSGVYGGAQGIGGLDNQVDESGNFDFFPLNNFFADPLGYASSMSLYDYCNGDPVNGLDPDGRIGSKFSSNVETDFNTASANATLGEDAIWNGQTDPEMWREAGISGFENGGIFAGAVATGGIAAQFAPTVLNTAAYLSYNPLGQILTAGVGVGALTYLQGGDTEQSIEAGIGSAFTQHLDNIQFNAYTPALPAFNGKTQGYLYTYEGDIVPLTSGTVYPQNSNYSASTHVEGQAALYINYNGSAGGIVYHNNPDGTCGFCNNMIETLLPEGATLTVVPPANAAPVDRGDVGVPTLYTGNANPIKPNKSTSP